MKAFFSSLRERRDSQSRPDRSGPRPHAGDAAGSNGELHDTYGTLSYREAAALKGIGPSTCTAAAAPFAAAVDTNAVGAGPSIAHVVRPSLQPPAPSIGTRRKSWGLASLSGQHQTHGESQAAAAGSGTSLPQSNQQQEQQPQGRSTVPLIPLHPRPPERSSLLPAAQGGSGILPRKRSIRLSTPNQKSSKDGGSSSAASQYPPSDKTRQAQVQALDGTSLATKLNELAVAYGDGLLSSEEYRTLRQGLFASMRAKELEVPIDHTIHGVPAVFAQPKSPTEVATESPPLANGKANHKPASIHSTKSGHSHLVSLFRKSSNGNKADASIVTPTTSPLREYPPSAFQGYVPGPDSSSHHGHGSASDRDSLRPPSMSRGGSGGSGGSSPGARARSGTGASSFSFSAGGGAGASSASTLSRFRFANLKGSQRMRDEEMQREFSAARNARSIMLGHTGSTGGGSTDGHSLLSAAGAAGCASGGGYVDGDRRLAEEIKAEITTVQMERERLLASFEALEQAALVRSPARHVVRKAKSVGMLRAGAGSGGSTSVTTTDGSGAAGTLGETNGGDAGTAGKSLMRRFSTTFNKKRESAMVDRTTAAVAAKLTDYADDDFAATTAAAAAADSLLASTSLDDVELKAEQERLQQELLGIAAQRENMARRYDERIAYLRSTLRSAMIKVKASK
ncbi:hypothetical protein K437DRAFT_56700 [Tilletiaria anomala UBC 951]|uniref:Uncharacterized protein n=1 Tax=Tilletiaria anomala (strain ATCC 24038 / CBS 436.72 / UBC 951) TaxID=1037660 RepID=A0A066WFU4_TILAU|nr:uncharacterized protein K437DRAFT_56700 [Tilletiaria anomala UBC 951]KDN51368.1 hypothetical protein K437DRAFT_56700 [Tilletiaria anomala UBC 951]